MNNKSVNEAKLNEGRKKNSSLEEEKKGIAQQYKHCEKLLDKAYFKYNNISNF
jgi:hypothetical protein